jgi:hypothetical protein
MNLSSPYSLLNHNENSDQFYHELSLFTDSILYDSEHALGSYASEFRLYLEQSGIKDLPSKNESLIQSIMPGIFWINYEANACGTKGFFIWMLSKLYTGRKKFPSLKNSIDHLRGFIGYKVLRHNPCNPSKISLSSYSKLLSWLQATGEFNEEVKKLGLWRQFLLSKEKSYALDFLSDSINYANQFFIKGNKALGEYTKPLENFRQNHSRTYKNREDYFFTSRKENEYYLNMVGAEILNRDLREEFNRTSQKVLLLPTCMRPAANTDCKAVFDGIEYKCMSCSKSCNIGKIAHEMRAYGIPTYLIPHSSGFSKTLAKWQGKKDVSLVGVACVLNLLTGGYEMKNLGISSQCVFLDYCGCKKHWHNSGIPTDLNIQQLHKTLKNDQGVLKVA